MVSPYVIGITLQKLPCELVVHTDTDGGALRASATTMHVYNRGVSRNC